MEITLPEGKGMIERSIGNPIAAPFRRAFQSGQPTGGWALVSLRDELRTVRLLGTLVAGYPPAERVFFFPTGKVRISDPTPPDCCRGRLVDHITQDRPSKPDRCSSHITYVDQSSGERHQHFGWTSLLSPTGLFPWLTLCFPAFDCLLPAPERIRIRGTPTRPDLPRLAKQLTAAMVSIGPLQLPRGSGDPCLLQIDVWVRRGGNRGTVVASRTSYRTLHGEASAHGVLSIQFTGQREVQIIVSRPAGTVEDPILLRPTRHVDGSGPAGSR
jgi:hypothetical protein